MGRIVLAKIPTLGKMDWRDSRKVILMMKDNETTYLLKKKETISQYLILQMEGCIQTEYVEIVNQ